MFRISRRRQLTALLLLALPAVAIAQPPVGPDPRPEIISPEALSDAIGGPTLVSLKFENARPEQVLRNLCEQAGIALDSYASTDLLKKMEPISVSVSEQPFTSTLANLAGQLGVSFTLKNPTGFDSAPSGMTLQLQKTDDPQKQMSGPMLVRGPFVVIATAIERKHSLGLDRADAPGRPPVARHEATIDFVILADPKLRQHGAYGAPSFTAPAGWRLRPGENEAPHEVAATLQKAGQ